MDNDVLEIQNLSALVEAKLAHPESEGLMSLETYLYGTTSISTEGLMSAIKSKFDKFIDKIVINLNKFIGIFRKLTHEEKANLQKMQMNRASADEKDTLPVSRQSITGVIKFIGMVAAWFGAAAFTAFVASRFKERKQAEREKMDVKQRYEKEAKRYEDIINKHEDRLDKREASRARLGVFGSVMGACGKLKDNVVNVKWDVIAKRAQQARAKADSVDAISDSEHRARNLGRNTILTAVILAWVTISAWIVNKALGVISKIASAFGVSKKAQAEDDFGDEF